MCPEHKRCGGPREWQQGRRGFGPATCQSSAVLSDELERFCSGRQSCLFRGGEHEAGPRRGDRAHALQRAVVMQRLDETSPGASLNKQSCLGHECLPDERVGGPVAHAAGELRQAALNDERDVRANVPAALTVTMAMIDV